MLTRNLLAVIFAAVMISFSGGAFADDVLPGYDYWATSENGTYVEFGGPTPVPPIPADFFGPGSDPFDGIISFMGDPIDPGALHAVSTITERLDVASLSPPYPSSAIVDIQFVDLQLRSIEPIRVTYFGGVAESFFDVFVDLNPLEPSTGQMTITQEHDGGGMYNEVWAYVFARFTFTPVEGGIPLELIPTDPYLLEVLGPDEMGYPWQLEPPFAPTFPSQGPNFFPIEFMPDVNLYWPYGPPWVKVGAHPVTPYVTCCFQDHTCRVVSVEEANYQGCAIQYVPCAGTLQGCCLPDGTCLMVDPTCCDDALGVVMGGGCGGIEACCVGPDCYDVDATCCALIPPGGGEAQGAGTDCNTTVCEGCGDGDCIPPEDQCNCPEDCGDPPQNETPLVNCQDTIDNDCDTLIDCDDPDCGADPACVPIVLKWEQLPDLAPTGIDVFAQSVPPPGVVLADDFLCSVTGPITRIQVWGSWLNDQLPGGDPSNALFTLSIHADDPDGPNGWSIPVNPPLWMRTFVPGEFSVEPFATDLEEGWYDPLLGWYEPFADSICWLYTFPVPEGEEFIQLGTPDVPIVYWLDVQAEPFLESYFGWKTSVMHWNDDAVWAEGIDPPLGPWNELRYPPMHQFAGQSIDLAFRIIGREEEPIGACCLDDYTCIDTTEADCTAQTGIFEGVGTFCGGMEACCIAIGRGTGCINADALCCVLEWGGEPEGPGTACMPDEACCYGNGDCLNYDPQCCVSQLWGVPQGQGNLCTAEEACCLDDGQGTCMMLDPLCCMDMGGTPQGPTAVCGALEACCLDNGECIMVDPLCCDDMGGTPQGQGSECTVPEGCCMEDGTCLDLDPLCCLDMGGTPQGPGTGCVDITIACCLPTGDCRDVDPLCCDDLGGEPSPLGMSHCLGDLNGNGINDACDDPPVIKWEQQPNPAFAGLHAHEDPPSGQLVLADQWICEGGVVTDFHWWGSYEAQPGSGMLDGFHLSIHLNVPGDPWCLPGPAVWSRDIVIGEFYEIPTGVVNIAGEEVFVYHYYLEQPFEQLQGEVYWLDITAKSVDPGNPVLWKWQEHQRAPTPIICPAAWSFDGVDPWFPFEWPPPEYTDMAFVVTSQPRPEGEPPDPEIGGPDCTHGLKFCHGGPDNGTTCLVNSDCAPPGMCWEDCWGDWSAASCIVYDDLTGAARCYIPKNRYLTIDPTVNPGPVAYHARLDTTANLDDQYAQCGLVEGWLTDPVCVEAEFGEPAIPQPPPTDPCTGPGLFGWVSYIEDGPAVPRIWQEYPLQVSGCKVAPAATYEMRMSLDGVTPAENPFLEIMTSHEPADIPTSQFWADVSGGPGIITLPWTPPDYTTSFADVSYLIMTFEGRGGPDLNWCDMEINHVLNFTDVSFVISAFEGTTYPALSDIVLPDGRPGIGWEPCDCPPNG